MPLFLTIGLALLGALISVAGGLIWNVDKKTAIVTATVGICLFVIMLAIAVAHFLLQKHDEAEELRSPRFSEGIRNVQLSLGAPNIAFVFDYEELKKRRRPLTPWTFGNYKPIQLSVENDRVKVSTTIYDRHGNTAVVIEKNKLIEHPPGWQINFDKDAIEVVDFELKPVFQMSFQTESQILFKGFFRGKDGEELVASDNAFTNKPDQPLERYKITRIFQYPARKYAGKRV